MHPAASYGMHTTSANHLCAPCTSSLFDAYDTCNCAMSLLALGPAQATTNPQATVTTVSCHSFQVSLLAVLTHLAAKAWA